MKEHVQALPFELENNRTIDFAQYFENQNL